MADIKAADTEMESVPENTQVTATEDVKVITGARACGLASIMPCFCLTSRTCVELTEDGKAVGDYVIQNPKSTGYQTALSGGMTLEAWDIENEQFYANEGKGIMTRNLWASIPNLLLGFAVWLMWSVTVARIQLAHANDPSAYYFKDFAGEYMGVSDGYRAPLYSERARRTCATLTDSSCPHATRRWLPGLVRPRLLHDVDGRVAG